MSVEKLNLKNDFQINGELRVNNLKLFINSYGKIQLQIQNGKDKEGNKIRCSYVISDRQQAHLLMLYLQEHLK